jgi:hypothetical protein
LESFTYFAVLTKDMGERTTQWLIVAGLVLVLATISALVEVYLLR